MRFTTMRHTIWFAINALNGGQSIWDINAKAVVASKEDPEKGSQANTIRYHKSASEE